MLHSTQNTQQSLRHKRQKQLLMQSAHAATHVMQALVQCFKRCVQERTQWLHTTPANTAAQSINNRAAAAAKFLTATTKWTLPTPMNTKPQFLMDHEACSVYASTAAASHGIYIQPAM
jgi:hypothetical protein